MASDAFFSTFVQSGVPSTLRFVRQSPAISLAAGTLLVTSSAVAHRSPSSAVSLVYTMKRRSDRPTVSC